MSLYKCDILVVFQMESLATHDKRQHTARHCTGMTLVIALHQIITSTAFCFSLAKGFACCGQSNPVWCCCIVPFRIRPTYYNDS